MPQYIPRHDWLVIRFEKLGMVGKLAVPDQASEGNRYVVVSKGPDCAPGVEKGDIVVIGGGVELGHNPGMMFGCPETKDLFLVKDKNVLAVRKKNEDS